MFFNKVKSKPDRAGEAAQFIRIISSCFRAALVLLSVAQGFSQTVATPAIDHMETASAFGGYAGIAAPGSYVEIYGSNLAETTRQWAASDFNGTAAPTSLDGVTVSVGGAAAFIRYVSPTQINMQVPDISPGSAAVVVSYQGQSSAASPLTINAQEPGLFAPPSFQVNGKQYVAAFHSTTGSYVSNGVIPGIPKAPLVPGETLIFYGIGFGAVTPSQAAGQTASGLTALVNPLTMEIGGSPATVSFAGLSPGSVGLYQFNVGVPTNVSTSDQSIQISLNGVASTLQTLFLPGSSPDVPVPPTNLISTAGNGSATIAFTAPASNGGAAITGYTAACTAGNATFTGTATASPIAVTGLSNGTTYTCTVTATNSAGTSSASASVAVTPTESTTPGAFTLTSSAAHDGGLLPAAYTCDGTGSTLPLAWSNPPAGTVEYALLLSTAPTPGTIKYDWVLYHIPATATSLAQDTFLLGTVGMGDDGPGAVYDPPCSQGPGAKVYTVTIYALSAAPTFLPGSQVTGELVASAIAPFTLESASLSVSYSRDPTTAPGSSTNCLYIRNSLQTAKSGATSIGCDGTYAYVSSIGLPVGSTSDPMMNGITSTNLQVPTPTDFQGANGWKIPLNPVLGQSPTPVASGPIGVAINGVPIFNPCVQNGNCTATNGDTKAEGQLDTCNGHAGRADDYHYHAAPNCLMAEQSTDYWNTHPVGWLLDGFAVFGYSNADGSTPARDSCGGATVSGALAPSGYPHSYAYHVMDVFPYITDNCISGVPSPDLANQASKYNPMRQPPVTPFNDTNMTLTTDPTDGYQVLQFTSATPFTTTETGSDSYANAPGTYKIRYKQVTGADLAALLALKQNADATACWNFEFVDSNGNTTQPSVSYCKTNP